MKRPFFLALAVAACSQRTAEVPEVPPKPEPGTAVLAGRVVDLGGQPLSGITVACPEGDAKTLTDDFGQFRLAVPAGATVTLRAFSEDPLSVYKPTTTLPVLLSLDQRLAGLELLVLPGSTVSELNAFVSSDENRGVLAVVVQSVGGKCTPEGGTVSLGNDPKARAFYNQAGTGQPLPQLTAIQAGSWPHAFLAGVGPGNYYRPTFTKEGCTTLGFPVAWNRVQWQGDLRVQPKGLTQVMVFTE